VGGIGKELDGGLRRLGEKGSRTVMTRTNAHDGDRERGSLSSFEMSDEEEKSYGSLVERLALKERRHSPMRRWRGDL